MRTLDAGADKPLAFADLGPEENPALGRRGLRLSAERPELLDAQLEALAVAARDTGADVRVMAPMVATAEEADWFARRVRENGVPKVRYALSLHSLPDCQGLAAAARGARTACEALDAVRAAVHADQLALLDPTWAAPG